MDCAQITQDGVAFKPSETSKSSGATSAWKACRPAVGCQGPDLQRSEGQSHHRYQSGPGRAAANAKGAHSTEGQTMDYIRHKTARKTGATQ